MPLFSTNMVISQMTDVARVRSTKLCMMFGCLSWYTIYTFLGALLLPLTEFCQVQDSLCIQVLHCAILAMLLHGTRAAAISQTLWCGTRNGIRELSQRCHLYSTGRPSRWASAHNLVKNVYERLISNIS